LGELSAISLPIHNGYLIRVTTTPPLGYQTLEEATAPMGGSIDAFASNPTELILDISGYFALAPSDNQRSVIFGGDDVTADWPGFTRTPLDQ
jgi:hypothetical protein